MCTQYINLPSHVSRAPSLTVSTYLTVITSSHSPWLRSPKAGATKKLPLSHALPLPPITLSTALFPSKPVTLSSSKELVVYPSLLSNSPSLRAALSSPPPRPTRSSPSQRNSVLIIPSTTRTHPIGEKLLMSSYVLSSFTSSLVLICCLLDWRPWS